MSSHDDAKEGAALAQAPIWTVVERTANITFCAPQMLIGRQVQTGLDGGAIEEAIVFAARDIREVGHIRDDRPGAILAIQAQECALLRKAVGFHIRLDGRLRSA